MPIILVCVYMLHVCGGVCVHVMFRGKEDVGNLYCSLLYVFRQGLSLTLELDWSLSLPPSLALRYKYMWPHLLFIWILRI